MYGGLADLPHFSPDLDVEPHPAAVASLRAQVGAADGARHLQPRVRARDPRAR